MPIVEPQAKRAVAFFDGQNLFRHAKSAFGHIHPNYEPQKLFNAICEQSGWISNSVRFYTGVPGNQGDVMWREYWSNRLLQMKRAGIVVTSRELRYHTEQRLGQAGTIEDVLVAREKGIDVRLALDIVRLARRNEYDVGVIFSQDQDLAEVANEVKEISREQSRWIKLVSAFPFGGQATTSRGVAGTDWFKIGQVMYDANLDPRDYRPKKK